ncbi:carbamate kinase [Nissabacter sp. SGAir0207]|uniref:carbamate kinase n=1 Tax=Nissabacter sp. SGAir0207 TaxID=2126321 RepID=UPI0010CD0EB1|nr:carbamate kinase [Nissabacter sp. SGAir0207]QCR37196.1 carbamate kinase [Nissabacter sp. SGAir0207]
MTTPTLVVALGGNALLKRGQPLEADLQQQNVAQAAAVVAALTADWRVVLVHGNGPQVGLLALQNSAYRAVAPYPLDVLGAESQGMIGYLLQQALKNCLPAQEVSVLLTQVEVAADDPAFHAPTKYIGPLYGAPEADALRHVKGWVMHADGDHFRRVVPSPRPQRIVELAAIQALLAQQHLVICCGGGGAPVVREGQGLRGVEAVIDKDLCAALLAEEIGADALLILTDAEAVCLDWGTPAQRALADVTPADLAGLTFDAGSMGPKVEAACRFATRSNGVAGIGPLQHGSTILTGQHGTRIHG